MSPVPDQTHSALRPSEWTTLAELCDAVVRYDLDGIDEAAPVVDAFRLVGAFANSIVARQA